MLKRARKLPGKKAKAVLEELRSMKLKEPALEDNYIVG